MIFLKVKGTKSWLDPRSQRALAYNLEHRLWSRCQGHRGLCLTLTYRRDEYRDALDLYRTQGEQQHVPLFLRKVARYLKLTGGLPDGGLKGRWFCKMEFQRGGWVHWHVIILDVPKIPHDQLTKLWGRGHVWVKRLNRRAVRYCSKYLAKDGPVPAFLYGEPAKSIKIVRVSPGFWPQEDGRPTCRPEPSTRWGFFVPIGAKIERAAQTVVVRDEDGRVRTCPADLGPLLASLMRAGCGVVGSDRGWVVVDAELSDVEAVLSPGGSLRQQGGPAAAPPPPLHSIGVPNRDAGWLRALLEERLTPQWEGGAA